MTPKPETQGETYAGMLDMLRAVADLKGIDLRRAWPDAMLFIEWQAARIEELRGVVLAGFEDDYISENGCLALAASAPDAVLHISEMCKKSGESLPHTVIARDDA